MGFNLFLDDERNPEDVTWVDLPNVDWVICRTYAEFVATVECRGLPELMSFDNDLGELKEGKHCAFWLVEWMMDNNISTEGLAWFVHSKNPVAAETIDTYLSNFVRHER